MLRVVWPLSAYPGLGVAQRFLLEYLLVPVADEGILERGSSTLSPLKIKSYQPGDYGQIQAEHGLQIIIPIYSPAAFKIVSVDREGYQDTTD